MEASIKFKYNQDILSFLFEKTFSPCYNTSLTELNVMSDPIDCQFHKPEKSVTSFFLEEQSHLCPSMTTDDIEGREHFGFSVFDGVLTKQ